MARFLISWLALAAATTARCAWAALEVDFDSADSIRAAAQLKAHDVMAYYKGNQTGAIPGLLPGPPPSGDYGWWQGGALWGTMIDYWHYTGDTLYNAEVVQALAFQAGPPQNMFMPLNWTATMGNDDQAFWGMAALLAAETAFEEQPAADQPAWLALAQAVFDVQASRVDGADGADDDDDDSTCGGGLRWQILPMNSGYDYKNAMSNGCLFNLGARLAHYTQNQTYADWAVRMWDWTAGVGLIDGAYHVYDGAHTETNCTAISRVQFSDAAAVYLQGAAFMYNHTQDAVWQTRVDGLLDNMLAVFFPHGIATEVSCETRDRLTCTTDMLSFKGYVHRWLAVAAQVAPFAHDRIYATLRTSAEAAAKQCTGGKTGRVCGFRWEDGAYDGTDGAGQEMNALGALLSMLMDEAPAPRTSGNNNNDNSSSSSSSSNNQTASQGQANASTTGPSAVSGTPTAGAGHRAGAALQVVFFVSGAVGLMVL